MAENATTSQRRVNGGVSLQPRRPSAATPNRRSTPSRGSVRLLVRHESSHESSRSGTPRTPTNSRARRRGNNSSSAQPGSQATSQSDGADTSIGKAATGANESAGWRSRLFPTLVGYNRFAHVLQQPGWTRTDLDTALVQDGMARLRFFRQLLAGASKLDTQQHKQLALALSLKRYKAPCEVFHAGDAADGLYIVLTGAALVVKPHSEFPSDSEDEGATITEQGKENHVHISYDDVRLISRPALELAKSLGTVVALLHPGDCMGEAGLVHDEPRNATIVTGKYTDLLFLSKADFTALGLHHRRVVYHPERCRELLQRPLRTDEDMVPLIQLAKTVPLFRQLSLDLVKRLCRSMRYLFMPKHTTICKEGDMGTLFYIILSGKVVVHKAGTVNEEQRIRLMKGAATDAERDWVRNSFARFGSRVCTLHQGDSFGHKGLITHVPRSATCIAETPCELVIVTRDDLDVLRAMATESAVFSMESCMRILRKPPRERTKDDVLFLSYNLVPAIPFLRNMPNFVSSKLVRWMQLQSFEPGELLATQGTAALHLHLVLEGEVRAYHLKQVESLSLHVIMDLAKKVRKNSGQPGGSGSHLLNMLSKAGRVKSGQRGSPLTSGATPRRLTFGAVASPSPAPAPPSAATGSPAPASRPRTSGSSTARPSTARSGSLQEGSQGAGTDANGPRSSPTHAAGRAPGTQHAIMEQFGGLVGHPTYGELVASYTPHDVCAEEVARGRSGVKYMSTLMALTEVQTLAVTRADFLRQCHHLRHRLLYAPARCRTTLMTPPGDRTEAQLAVVKACFQHLPVFQALPAPLLATLARVAGYKRLRRGEIIVDEREQDRQFATLMAGHASVHSKSGKFGIMDSLVESEGRAAIAKKRRRSRAVAPKRKAGREPTGSPAVSVSTKAMGKGTGTGSAGPSERRGEGAFASPTASRGSTVRRTPSMGQLHLAKLMAVTRVKRKFMKKVNKKRSAAAGFDMRVLMEEDGSEDGDIPTASLHGPHHQAPDRDILPKPKLDIAASAPPKPEPASTESQSGAGKSLLLALRVHAVAKSAVSALRNRRLIREAPATTGRRGSNAANQLWSRVKRRGLGARGSVDDSAIGHEAVPVEEEVNVSVYHHPLPASTGVYNIRNLIGNTRQFGVCTGVLGIGDSIGTPSVEPDPHAFTVVATTAIELIVVEDEDRGLFRAAENDLVLAPSLSRLLLRTPTQHRDKYTVDHLTRLARSVAFFRQLQPDVVRSLAQVMTLRLVQAGDVIFKQGDVGDAFFVILTGSVRVVVDPKFGHLAASNTTTGGSLPSSARPMYRLKDTDEASDQVSKFGQVVGTMYSGDSFGEKSLLNEVLRTATTVANDMTELLVVTKRAFLSAAHTLDAVSYQPDTMVRSFNNVMWAQHRLLATCAEVESQFYHSEAVLGHTSEYKSVPKVASLPPHSPLRVLRLHWASLVPLMRAATTREARRNKKKKKSQQHAGSQGTNTPSAVNKLRGEHIDNLIRRQRRLLKQVMTSVRDFEHVAHDARNLLADELEVMWFPAAADVGVPAGKAASWEPSSSTTDTGEASLGPRPASVSTASRAAARRASLAGGELSLATTPARHMHALEAHFRPVSKHDRAKNVGAGVVMDEGVWCVLSGVVDVFTDAQQSDRLATVKEGGLVGVYEALSDTPRCTIARARTNVYVAYLSKRAFCRLASQFPSMPSVSSFVAFQESLAARNMAPCPRCWLFTGAKYLRLTHKSVAFPQGSPATSFGVVVSGEVKVVRRKATKGGASKSSSQAPVPTAVTQDLERHRLTCIQLPPHAGHLRDVVIVGRSQCVGIEDCFFGSSRTKPSMFRSSVVSLGTSLLLQFSRDLAYRTLSRGPLLALTRAAADFRVRRHPKVMDRDSSASKSAASEGEAMGEPTPAGAMQASGHGSKAGDKKTNNKGIMGGKPVNAQRSGKGSPRAPKVGLRSGSRSIARSPMRTRTTSPTRSMRPADASLMTTPVALSSPGVLPDGRVPPTMLTVVPGYSHGTESQLALAGSVVGARRLARAAERAAGRGLQLSSPAHAPSAVGMSTRQAAHMPTTALIPSPPARALPSVGRETPHAQRFVHQGRRQVGGSVARSHGRGHPKRITTPKSWTHMHSTFGAASAVGGSPTQGTVDAHSPRKQWPGVTRPDPFFVHAHRTLEAQAAVKHRTRLLARAQTPADAPGKGANPASAFPDLQPSSSAAFIGMITTSKDPSRPDKALRRRIAATHGPNADSALMELALSPRKVLATKREANRVALEIRSQAHNFESSAMKRLRTLRKRRGKGKLKASRKERMNRKVFHGFVPTM